ncbi:MAG: hypothetical protein C5S48_07895 [Candidatus Methanogaster sp.]|nr:MAG: hypothetical protein C5S48_07895 [ANME-2 cluster archaeon]
MNTEPWSTMKKMLAVVSVVALLVSLVPLVFTTCAASQEPEANVTVRVNAPEPVSGTFEVTIEIAGVSDLDSGQFDLTFDPDVLSVSDVTPGSIEGTEVPIGMWRVMDQGRVRVTANIDGTDGVSGSGYISRIIFETRGSQGDTSAINLSKGMLNKPTPIMDTDPSKWAATIPANWLNDTVAVGAAAQAAPTLESTPRPASNPKSYSSPDTDSTPATESAMQVQAAAAATTTDPALESNTDEPGGWGGITMDNFIEVYLFIGLIAIIYTLTMLR